MDSADLATPVDCKPRIAEKEATYDLETPKTVVAAEIGVFFRRNPPTQNHVGFPIFSQLQWFGPASAYAAHFSASFL